MSGRLRQLARQGRLAEDDLVRMGRTGQWVSAGSIEWLNAKPRLESRVPHASTHAPQLARPSAIAQWRTSLAYSLRNIYYSITHAIIASLWLIRHVLGVVALIAIGIVLFRIARDSGLFGWETSVDAVSTVQSLGAEIKQKRAAKAPEAEWNDLKQRGTAALATVIVELEHEAGAHNRTAQMLLWSARDCLPAMFDDARIEPSESESRYDEYMANVAALQKNEPIYGGSVRGQAWRPVGSYGDRYKVLTESRSWSTVATVSLLVPLDLLILLWLVRAWRRRRT